MKNIKTIAAVAVITGFFCSGIGARPVQAQGRPGFNPLLASTFGSAQQPEGSLQHLQSRLKAGDELKVIDRSKKTTTGQLLSISGSSLTLLVRGIRQEFSEAAIREIKVRRPHGAKNVLFGAAIGGAAGGAFAAAAHPGADGSNSGTTSRGVLIGAVIGAGGVAVKQLFTKRYDTVFRATASPSRP